MSSTDTTSLSTVTNMGVALAAVKNGWHVVPVQVYLGADGKKKSHPLKSWKTESTNDWETARDWWVQDPDAVVGILTKKSGLLVVDLDLHHEGANGIEAFQRLLDAHNGGAMPETFTVTTPTGGLHLYFRNTDERLKNSASKLGAGIDTRGAGDRNGGLIYAGQRYDGAYAVLDDSEVAPLPQWLADLLAPSEDTQRAERGAWDRERSGDRRFTVDQAREFVLRYGLTPLAAAVPGHRNHALNTAAICFAHFGPEFWPEEFAEGKLRDVASEIGYTDEPEVTNTIASGLRADTWGATLTGTEETKDDDFETEVAREVLRREVRQAADEIMESRKVTKSIRDMMMTRDQLDALPGVEPLIEHFLYRRSVALLYGRRNVGKTFAALDMALSVATGIPWAKDLDGWVIGDGAEGSGFKTRKGKVLWIAGEGVHGIHPRITAWEKEHGQRVSDIAITTGALEFASDARVKELEAIIREDRIDLIVIDTLARNSAGLEENSASDMKVFFERVDRLKNAHDGACVLIVHHQGKGESKESRGSTVIEDAPESVFAMSGDSRTVFFETTKQRDTVKAARLTFHLAEVEATNSAVMRRGAAYSAETVDDMTTEEKTLDIYMTHFSETGCTSTQLKSTVMKELECSGNTALRYINDFLRNSDAVKKVDQGKGTAFRIEVA